MRRLIHTSLLLVFSFFLFVGCDHQNDTKINDDSKPKNEMNEDEKQDLAEAEMDEVETEAPVKETQQDAKQDDTKQVAANPASIAVLVNKQYALPENYHPNDLVYPDVPFLFEEKIEKRMMRSEAASALGNLFTGAKKEGIHLAGVSAYRSHATQKSLFDRYVQKDGMEKAKRYSAVPGHSEHETGLAIDVSGSDGRCAVEDCFADTEEATWLANHAWEYGFIIRYPQGKEEITGYQYEPWHLRYVGIDIAKEIQQSGKTLEEYSQTISTSKEK